MTSEVKVQLGQRFENPIGMDGLEFIEYTSPDADRLEQIFIHLGFSRIGDHKIQNVSLYQQNNISFIINRESGTFADRFQSAHGPSICATGFRVFDAKKAFDEAVKRGACPCEESWKHTFPAIYGIGDSLVYFVDGQEEGSVFEKDFALKSTEAHKGNDLITIDHMTNNVPVGALKEWCDFYEGVFNFKEIRSFDIQGKETGLFSRALLAPDGEICIPINEPKDIKSQIQEYIDEYKGSGIQHIALATNDICATIVQLREQGIEFLDTPDTYYETLKDRVPNVTEDIEILQKYGILVDGDEKGYLLQIFTKNLIGPIFFEIIQRKNHGGFGEGNFQALFDSIEEDQRRRGVL